MAQPIIGLTLDSEPPGGYSKTHAWYALRENYCTAVARAGGLPILLPHEPDRAAAYLGLIHGLVVTGGAFDVDPALFGADTKHPTVTTKDRRTAFELAITKGAAAADKPVLGICGGQQLLNVALGGTLIQHIPDEVEGALAHEQPNPRTEAGHAVRITRGSLLHRVTGAEELPVNSAHHQAVKESAPGLVVDAVAPDGVIEGIEDAGAALRLGVQWHPEYAISEGDDRSLRRLHRRRRGPEMTEDRRASASPRRWRAPDSARAATPSAGSPKAASRSTARCSTSPALVVERRRSDIRVDGKPLPTAEPTRLWRYHKPAGLVTDASRRAQGRPTVFEQLPPELPRLVSVGRLDLNSEGLLLLTNDGGLARTLELPSRGWLRRYRAARPRRGRPGAARGAGEGHHDRRRRLRPDPRRARPRSKAATPGSPSACRKARTARCAG